MKREGFKSRLGFILVSAGCAIGIGNVWRFPFVAGQNGGGIFVLLYLIFLLCMGVPVLTMELSIGRASKKSIVLGYKDLEKPKHKWHIHGWFCILGCYLLMIRGNRKCIYETFVITCRDGNMDDINCCAGIFCLFKGIAKWSRENQQVYDVSTFNLDCGVGCS